MSGKAHSYTNHPLTPKSVYATPLLKYRMSCWLRVTAMPVQNLYSPTSSFLTPVYSPLFWSSFSYPPDRPSVEPWNMVFPLQNSFLSFSRSFLNCHPF